jgi:hypothetical protein
MAKSAKATKKAPPKAQKAQEETPAAAASVASVAAKRVEKAVAAVADVIRAAGWDALREELDTGVAFGVMVEDGEPISHGHAEVLAEVERFVLVFVFRKKAPKKRRAEVAELITRINYGMVTGCFEMDFDGGEVRYRYGLDFNGVELDPLLVRNAILSSLDAIETYMKPVADVMAGKATPKDAVRAAELAMMEEADEPSA